MTKAKANWNQLNDEESRVILRKGTEYPGTGEYNDFKAEGTFVCRQCESPLYDSNSKFNAGCGWPSFDDSLLNSIERVMDADGRRIEIVCKNCKGHLGHVFEGEQLTVKNTRHCVNSVSIKFVARI